MQNLLAYVFAFFNLQNSARVGVPIGDTSIIINSLSELKKELVSLQEFPLEGYKKDGFQKNSKLGVYASNNLREYIYEGRGKPNEEGVIIKLYYGGDTANVLGDLDAISYFIHKDEVDQQTKREVNEHVVELSKKYTRGRRNKRSLIEKIIYARK